MKLYVKNMVCNRCVLVVRSELEKLGFEDMNVGLGEVELKENELTTEQKTAVKNALEPLGFELIDDRKTQLIEKIKTFTLQYLQNIIDSGMRDENLSQYLSKNLHYDYSYLSDLFSGVEGITIENYFLQQRIEKVKEFIVYDQMSLSQIALELGFSSVHHLSAQFKKITGLTPTHFKKLGSQKRRSADEV